MLDSTILAASLMAATPPGDYGEEEAILEKNCQNCHRP
jgi:hypothetical protein